mmetsp:Transcript_1169/g.2931  ORF Transcript_1169/g.2931 Transcript_1169/m.2931 type:complete len:211 (-) Transcript_1169:170-802(-)
MEAEAEDARHVGRLGLGREAREAKGHEEEVGKGGAEEGTVDGVGDGGGGPVDVAAARAIEDDLLDADAVVEAEGQDGIVVAIEAGAAAKVAAGVLGVHGFEAVGRDDVARVDEAVELDDVGAERRGVPGGDAGFLAVVVDVAAVEDHVEAVAEVIDDALEAVEVEAVLDVVAVDLAEKLVAPGLAEARNPRRLRLVPRALHPIRRLAARR